MAFETEREVREYVEKNTDKAVHVNARPLGELWFAVDDEGDFAVIRAASVALAMSTGAVDAVVPHRIDPKGDDTVLPSGNVEVVPRDEMPFAV